MAICLLPLAPESCWTLDTLFSLILQTSMSFYFVQRCTLLGSPKRNALLGRPAKTRGLTCTGDLGPPPRAGHCSSLQNGMRPMSRAVGFTEIPCVKCSAWVLARRKCSGNTNILIIITVICSGGSVPMLETSPGGWSGARLAEGG